MQVGESEACEFFGIACSGVPSPLQVPLKEAAAAVPSIDVRASRPVHRPDRLCRPSHRHVVDHPRAPAFNRCQLSAMGKVSDFAQRPEGTESTVEVRTPSAARARGLHGGADGLS